jgi:hypothetical protein
MGNAYFTIFAKVDFDGFVESSRGHGVLVSSAVPLAAQFRLRIKGGAKNAPSSLVLTGFEFQYPREKKP